MFNWVLRNVIGGKTGKRELCLFLLFWWFALSGYLLWRERIGQVSAVGEMIWKMYSPIVFGLTAGAFSLDWHHKQNKGGE